MCRYSSFEIIHPYNFGPYSSANFSDLHPSASPAPVETLRNETCIFCTRVIVLEGSLFVFYLYRILLWPIVHWPTRRSRLKRRPQRDDKSRPRSSWAHTRSYCYLRAAIYKVLSNATFTVAYTVVKFLPAVGPKELRSRNDNATRVLRDRLSASNRRN